jgi:hypothetical protein
MTVQQPVGLDEGNGWQRSQEMLLSLRASPIVRTLLGGIETPVAIPAVSTFPFGRKPGFVLFNM